MSDRVILNDCCEDWIVQWGGFYAPGGAFLCPECATPWEKTAPASYRRASDRHEFVRRERVGPEDRFPYLAAADGREPRVERCCTKILLTHGDRMPDGVFVCPVCRTRWSKRSDKLHGLRVPVFEKEGLAEPLTIQPGRPRPFLVEVSEYTPPRD